MVVSVTKCLIGSPKISLLKKAAAERGEIGGRFLTLYLHIDYPISISSSARENIGASDAGEVLYKESCKGEKD